MNINDATKIKEQLEKKASRGFGYFFKNILMVILVFCAVFILTNPESITSTTEFFSKFSLNSLWVVFALLLIICGFYQLYKSIQAEDKKYLAETAITNYEKAIEKREEEEKEKHNQLIQKRFDSAPLIANELKSLLINLDADRAAILEMHNGTNNLAGLPCVYGDMIYEEISPRVHYARDEFKKFNLARIPFVALHYLLLLHLYILHLFDYHYYFFFY